MMTQITYLADSFVWSVSTLLMCINGQLVHWLLSYGRARQISKALNTPMPGLWLYWYADWPTTAAAVLITFSGYFMIPDIGRQFPEIGKAFGIVSPDGEVVGLSMLSAFLWGIFGNMVSDILGRRFQKMVE